MKYNLYKLFVFFLFIFISLIFPYSAHALETVEITTLDNAANSSAGSYSQHVVQNQYGIFLTYLKKYSESTGLGTWKLMRSTDNGKTFTTLYTSQNHTSPPVLETDSHGVIYLAYPETDVSTNAYFYRFFPENNFTEPTITTIPKASSGKFAMILDEPNGQLYYLSHYGRFVIIGMDGQIRKNFSLVKFEGASAYMQYPLLTLDEKGVLYAAWTTQKKDQYLYWDIHFMLSKDGGVTWQKLDGSALQIPVRPDETGPTDRVTLDDEFTVHTFLSTLLAKNNKIYFPYLAQFEPYRQHFARYDTLLAKKDLDIYPTWKGTTIQLDSLHLFCATRLHESTYPIYCVGEESSGRLGVLVSYDQGATWKDYAVISDPADTNPWLASGAREITSDGYLIGTYTNQISTTKNNSAVRFFRIKATDAPPPPDFNIASYWPMDETSGTIVNDHEGSHNGTTTALIVDGKSGKARKFVSKTWNTNTKIQFPSFSADFDTGTGFTVEAWIKKDSSTAGWEHRVIGNRYSWNDPNGWYLAFPSNEKIIFSAQSASTPSVGLFSTDALSTGTWYHIAGVYDNGTLKLYINGELNNTVSDAGYTPSNRELTIGGQPNSSNYGFDGLIDEVHLYSSALSAETIRQHFLGSNPADLNGDGKVDAGDYTIFVADFGKTGTPGFIPADIDQNGGVDIFDYRVLVRDFGKGM